MPQESPDLDGVDHAPLAVLEADCAPHPVLDGVLAAVASEEPAGTPQLPVSVLPEGGVAQDPLVWELALSAVAWACGVDQFETLD